MNENKLIFESNNQLNFTKENNKEVNVFAKSFVDNVNEDLLNIKKNFFAIGFRLDEAQRLGYYTDLSFENIVDCAEHFFGFQKTLTYNLISVYRTFNENGKMYLPIRWQKYSQSQLVEMSNCYELKQVCSPSDSIKDIKYFKRLLKENGYYCSSCIKTLPEYISVLEKISEKNNKEIENKEKQTPNVISETKENSKIFRTYGKIEKSEITDLEKNGEKKTINVVFDTKKHSDIFRTYGKNEKQNVDNSEKKVFNNVVEDFLIECEKNFIDKIKQNDITLSMIKKYLIEKVNDELSKFDYSIKLLDRTQSLKVFLGNVFNCLLKT